ncbi:MAG: hypothetical protein IT385_08630 [Deltaproteobacteria bacterium]|nr:hypothetical protein [Deltaproteobacteria bacterium]
MVLNLASDADAPTPRAAEARAALTAVLPDDVCVTTAHALEHDDVFERWWRSEEVLARGRRVVVIAFDSGREDGRVASLVDAWRTRDAFRGTRSVAMLRADDEVAARVPGLAARATEALVITAIAGRPVRESTLVALLRAPIEGDGLWIEDGWVSLPSERRRVEILSGLTPEARAERLRTLARASADPDPERAAEFACALGAWDAAFDHLAAAARSASSRGRWSDAARLATQALQRPGPALAERQRLQLLRGRALSAVGASGPATDAYLAAMHGPDADAARQALWSAAHEALVAGRLQEGDALLGRALKDVGLGGELGRAASALGVGWRRLVMMLERGRRARPHAAASPGDMERLALLWAATTATTFVDGLRTLALQTRYLALALEVGEPRHVVRALALERTMVAARGVAARDRVRALDATVAAHLATVTDDRIAVGVDLGTRGQAAFFLGDFREALRALDAAEDAFASCGAPVGVELYIVRVFRIWTWVWMGEIEALDRLVAELGDRIERLGHRALTDTLAVEVGTLLALLDGRHVHARERAERAWRQHGARRVLPIAAFNAWVALVNALLHDGEGERAWALVEGAWRRFGLSGFLVVQVIRVEAWLVRGRAALASGRTDEVARVCRQLRRERAGYARALAAFLEVGLDLRRGLTATDRWREARRACDDAGLGLYREAITRALAARGAGDDASRATWGDHLERVLWGLTL